MKFALTIGCGTPPFQPINDDAGEAERYEDAAFAVADVLRVAADRMPTLVVNRERSGQLHDVEGNRCGAWSLTEEEEGQDARPSPLAALWAKVKAYDDRMNAEDRDDGPRAPTGDDYNELFAMVRRAAEDAGL